MIYKHKPSGRLYRKLGEAWDTQTQRPAVIYLCLETGGMFVRDKVIFEHKFMFMSNAQQDIKPKAPKPPLEEQLELFGESK